MRFSLPGPYLSHILLSALYLVPLIYVLQHRKHRATLSYLTAIFIGLAALLHFGLTAGQSGALSADAADRLIWYGQVVLALLTWVIMQHFLQKKQADLSLIIGMIWLLGILILDSNLLNLPDILWENQNYYLPRYRLVFTLAIIGWAFFTSAAVLTGYRAYKTTWQTLHRNRISYWAVIFALFITHDALLWTGKGALGAAFQLSGIAVLSYLITTHHLPDARQILRAILTYLLTGALLGIFYAGVFLGLQYLYADSSSTDTFTLSIFSALLTAFLFNPLWHGVNHFMSRLFPIEVYDPAETLQHYGIKISNIIRVQELASVAVTLIIEALELSRGFLFLVDRVTDEMEDVTYTLKNANPDSARTIRNGTLSAESPIVQTLLKNQPLLQYDVDLLPHYQAASAQEREWLAHLGCEIYVPIISKGEWIGLLALGGKISGHRFTDADMKVLGSLANQTAAGLENARLVENLTRLNKELRTAYTALDQANQRLERLDRTKSDFISIASHELRTPLTVMLGYIEMLLEDQTLLENPYHKKMLEGVHQGTLRLHEIMDSMFDIAQIDSRTLELHLQEIDLVELIKSVASELVSGAKERKQVIRMELPPLPTIKADPATLRKVFYHLITNAIKFTPDGGRITIRGLSHKPGPDYAEGAVEIIVSDTGVGIDPNFRELIFTKFYQPEDELNHHSTGKTKFKGSGAGLGLALSRGIVEAHGGKIWAESPGYDEVNFPGSDFHVVLPIRHPREQKTQVLQPTR